VKGALVVRPNARSNIEPGIMWLDEKSVIPKHPPVFDGIPSNLPWTFHSRIPSMGVDSDRNTVPDLGKMTEFSINSPSPLFSVVSFLDIKLITITESLPDPLSMTLLWFLGQITDHIRLDEIEIVLISDPRSFFFTNLLLACPDFHGIVLCTDPVYRLGRLLLREISRLLENRFEPLPTNHSIISLKFQQPFPYGEIALIPMANGCGLGSCNWVLTKGIDPELVTFSAFIITGYCSSHTVFTPPQAFPKPTAVCVLPSAVSEDDVRADLEAIAEFVLQRLKAQQRVIIPAFVDDSLYLLMHYLRITKSCSGSYAFWVASYTWDQLFELMFSMANPTELPQITGTLTLDMANPPAVLLNCVIFGSYPIGNPGFGQIVLLKQGFVDPVSSFLSIFEPGSEFLPFRLNSNVGDLKHFVEQMSPQIIFGPPELNLPQNTGFPGSVALPSSVSRWMDVLEIKKHERRIGTFPAVAGRLEGERAIAMPIARQYVLNAPRMEELARLLIEEGATSLKRDGNVLTCAFRFVKGDNQVSIEFGEPMTIVTGSTVIENVIYGLIGGNIGYAL
jgi:hypothetical protein